MKKIVFLIFILAAIFAESAFAQGGNSERHLSAVFSYSTFYQYETGPYLETYLSFDAWNLNFKKRDGKYQATVEVIITVSKNDTIEIAKKYELNSPKIDDLSKDHFNFIDMQRFGLAKGIHDIEVTLHDINSDDSPTVVREQVALYYDNRRPALSSVQMMSNVKPTETPNIMSRNGYDMEPYINDFLPEQVGRINYYCELYNINKETKDPYVYLFSFIETQETGTVLEATQTAQRLERDSIIPIFGVIDIDSLPSGNYNLVVEIRNKHNDKMLYKRLPFMRSNPGIVQSYPSTPIVFTFAGELKDESQLNDYIESLYAIANEAERREIYRLIKVPGLEEKQSFLYKFWTKRDALQAEQLWRNYRKLVDYVNANFGWINTKGIQTDRGRVYLQYGPPDYVRDEKNYVSTKAMGSGVTVIRSANVSERPVSLGEKNATHGQVFYLPYQLWRYNRPDGDDANRCFIFWDEFRSGHYKLLHSNAKGEVRDTDWEHRLSGGQLPTGILGEVGEQFQRGH